MCMCVCVYRPLKLHDNLYRWNVSLKCDPFTIEIDLKAHHKGYYEWEGSLLIVSNVSQLE